MEALERPGPTFLGAYVRRLREAGGAEGATREALAFLGPRIGWANYGAYVPLGLVGLRAVWRLKEVLPEASFLRALGLQLAMAAREGRGAAPADLSAHPLPDLWPDMATMGFKPVFAQHFADLDRTLGTASEPLVAHLAALVAPDTFWHRLATRKLEAPDVIPTEAAMVEVLLEGGVVETMECLVAHLREGHPPSALLEPLMEAACFRLLDADRELEAKTTWLLVYLAALAEAQPTDPRPWLQAGALVNFFPGEGLQERSGPRPPRTPTTLLDAVLDGEPSEACFLAEEAGDSALPALAEAASRNDPAFCHGRQMMAVAAAMDLAAHLSPPRVARMAGALAKSLAHSQVSCDQALLADRLLGAQ